MTCVGSVYKHWKAPELAGNRMWVPYKLDECGYFVTDSFIKLKETEEKQVTFRAVSCWI